MKRANGLDSSAHDIFFEPAEAEIKVDFAMLRTGYALMRDKIFLDSAARSEDAGLLWMVYHYLSTGVPWRDQIESMLSMVNQATRGANCAGPFAYWIDFETAYNEMSISFAIQCAEAINLLRSLVEKKVGLYTNNDLYDRFIAKSGDWHLDIPLWISWPINDYHNDRQPLIPEKRLSKGWDFWQRTYKGNGLKHGLGRYYAADLDVFNGSLKDLKKWLGPHPSTAPGSAQDPPSEVVSLPAAEGLTVKTVDTSWVQSEKGIEIINTVKY